MQLKVLTLTTLALCAWPAVALAQASPLAPPTTISPITGVAMVLGLVLGFVNQGVANGTILTFGVPKAIVPYLSMLAVFLTAFIPNFTALTVVTSGGIFVCVCLGLGALVTYNVGANAKHQHDNTTRTLADGAGSGSDGTGGGKAGGMGTPFAAKPVDAVTAAANALKLSWARGLLRSAGVAACFVGLTWLASFGIGSSCQVTPQTQADIVAAEQLAACAEGVYAADSQKVPPPAIGQILIDEGSICGPDVGTVVVNIFAAPTAVRPARLELVAAAQTADGKAALARGAASFKPAGR